MCRPPRNYSDKTQNDQNQVIKKGPFLSLYQQLLNEF